MPDYSWRPTLVLVLLLIGPVAAAATEAAAQYQFLVDWIETRQLSRDVLTALRTWTACMSEFTRFPPLTEYGTCYE